MQKISTNNSINTKKQELSIKNHGPKKEDIGCCHWFCFLFSKNKEAPSTTDYFMVSEDLQLKSYFPKGISVTQCKEAEVCCEEFKKSFEFYLSYVAPKKVDTQRATSPTTATLESMSMQSERNERENLKEGMLNNFEKLREMGFISKDFFSTSLVEKQKLVCDILSSLKALPN